MSNFYYGATNNRKSLYHKGTKGMKWGYNEGKRNGKRTAGEGPSFSDLMKIVPGDTPIDYDYKGKTYRISDYESYAGGGGRVQYSNGNHKIWVKDGNTWTDRSITSIGGDTKVTQIEKGKLTQYKEKVDKWLYSLTDKKVTINGKSHIEKGRISKSIDKGKKYVNNLFKKIKKKVSNIGKKPKAKVTTGRLTAYKNDF